MLLLGGYGGPDLVDVFDEINGGIETHFRWDYLPPLLEGRCFLTAAWIKGEVFCVSGGSVKRWDMMSKRRTLVRQRLPLLNLGLVSVAVLNDKLHIIGGLYAIEQDRLFVSDAVYCLEDDPTDPAAATFSLQHARLNIPRSRHASIVFEKKIGVAWGAGC